VVNPRNTAVGHAFNTGPVKAAGRVRTRSSVTREAKRHWIGGSIMYGGKSALGGAGKGNYLPGYGNTREGLRRYSQRPLRAFWERARIREKEYRDAL
jgi:hypothetical protein